VEMLVLSSGLHDFSNLGFTLTDGLNRVGLHLGDLKHLTSNLDVTGVLSLDFNQ